MLFAPLRGYSTLYFRVRDPRSDVVIKISEHETSCELKHWYYIVAPTDSYLLIASAGSSKSGFRGIRKIGARESRGFQFNSRIPPFPVYARCLGRAFILFYGSALSCVPSYCVRCLSICVSNKTSEPETIFSSLSLFALNQRGHATYIRWKEDFRRREEKGRARQQIRFAVWENVVPD